MRIQKGCTVTLKYSVTDEEGELIDPGAEPMVYLHGDLDGLFPKLQAALEGKGLNETVTATLHATEAFGPYDHNLVRMEHRARFDFEIEVGMSLEGQNNKKEPLVFVIREIQGDRVTLDANHPLAGLNLIFTCTPIDIQASN